MIRPQSNACRDSIDLSGLWRIAFDPEDLGEELGWSEGLSGPVHTIAVPGSWNEQLAEAGYMNYLGAAWLERELVVPPHAGGRALILRFGSADYRADVWVNGVPAGRSGAEHLPFEVDATGLAGPGERLRIVVRVDSRLPEQGPTQRVTQADYLAEGRVRDEYLPAVRYDFFPYGGLARPVHLCLVPQTRIEAVTLACELEAHAARFAVRVRLNTAPEAPVTARIVFQADGHPARAFEMDLASGEEETSCQLPDCPLWSPASPQLLDVTVTLNLAGERVDEVALRTGAREVKVRGRTLLLNGEPLELRGFGKHEDCPVHGRGLNLPLLVKDFQLLKWCGANSVRTSHYPYAEEFYDLADEHGILVIDEVFSINLDFRKVTPEGLEAHKAAVAQLIARDGHRACVIAWSLANEPGYLGEACYRAASAPYWAELFAHARALDPTRPLTHANVGYAGLDDPAFDHADFLMINRYHGWYQAPGQLDRAAAALRGDFDHLAAAHDKPLFVSEFGADAMAGQHATTPQLFTEDYQADLIEVTWREILAHPAVIGGHVWNFADFRTAQHSRRVVLNLKGVFTRDRTPKKAALRLRELWRQPAPATGGEGRHDRT